MTINKLLPVLLIVLANVSMGATHYVSSTGSHTSPYDTWATAATNIQDAVDVAIAGDTVLVADGVYVLSSQISITNAISLVSQNNQGATIDGNGSVRCLRITASDVQVDGFRIQNGTVNKGTGGPAYGGNLYCDDNSAVIENCVISDGYAAASSNGGAKGGGAYNGTYLNCEFLNNEAVFYGFPYQGGTTIQGGAVFGGVLTNCNVIGNASSSRNMGPQAYGGGLALCEADACRIQSNNTYNTGGGVFSSTLRNCLVVGNEANSSGSGARDSALENCTVADNIGQGIYGGSATNCIIYSNTVANWAGTVSVAYSCTTPDPGGDGNTTQFDGFENGYVPVYNAEIANTGIYLSWMIGAVDLAGAARVINGSVDMGCYELPGLYHYVVESGSTPLFPYDSWATAATNIQDAVNACSNTMSDVVLIDDGVYVLTQQVLIATDNVIVQSVNGPGATTIDGNGSVRCLRITGADVSVEGFRIQGGYLYGSGYNVALYGANVYCNNDTSTFRNCIIANGIAFTAGYSKARGAGAYNGTYINCTFSNNVAKYAGSSYSSKTEVKGGAVYSGILENCAVVNNSATRPNNFGPPTYGGGVFSSEATRCILQGNYARAGGGAYSSTLKNCLVVENETHSGGAGAGVKNSTLESCTVADNIGQGMSAGSATNCIIYGNTVSNWAGTVDIAYSCTTPDPGGTGNILSFEGFDSDYYPQQGSVVLNAALEMSWMAGGTDLLGFPRVIDSGPDMGCQEYFGTRGIDSIEVQGNDAILTFDLFDGVNGMLQATDDLTNAWTDVTSFSGAGTISVTNDASGSPCKFFRLKYVSPYTVGVGVASP